MLSSLKLLLALILTLTLNMSLSGCFALQNVFSSANTTQSYFTENIFLDPLILSKKTIYINFRNSTIFENLDAKEDIKQKLEFEGYEIVNSPLEAGILIQSNIRYYGIFDKEILNAMLEDKTKKDKLSKNETEITPDIPSLRGRSKYDIDFSGIIIGGAVSFSIFQTVLAGMAGGIVGGILSITLERLYESKMIIAVVDVQISEKSDSPIKEIDFRQTNHGEGGTRKVEYESSTNFKNYKTKLLVVSKKANLNDKKAIKQTKKQITAAITGLI
jgi:hypothetical protein